MYRMNVTKNGKSRAHIEIPAKHRADLPPGTEVLVTIAPKPDQAEIQAKAQEIIEDETAKAARE